MGVLGVGFHGKSVCGMVGHGKRTREKKKKERIRRLNRGADRKRKRGGECGYNRALKLTICDLFRDIFDNFAKKNSFVLHWPFHFYFSFSFYF